MSEITGEDGCPAFKATLTPKYADPETTFKWGEALDGPGGNHLFGNYHRNTECFLADRYSVFKPDVSGRQTEKYYFTFCRKLGANKVFEENNPNPALEFAVWAPHAQAVSVVFGKDAEMFGGNNYGNLGATISSAGGNITLAVPGNGFVILVKSD